ncbi:MAG: hypothetical protein LBN27_03300 [Prevotellaceae bacterium]|nr:hypothetical protein [Prevotellaceae bacterium]
MKKLIVILGLIGFGFIAVAWNPNHYVCTKCNIELDRSEKRTSYWITCSECGGDGKVTCDDWETCSYCRGTTCKGGYTKDNGKYCAYGKCTNSRCDGGQVRTRKTDCDCRGCNEYIVENGRRVYGKEGCCNTTPILVCPSCRAEYN